MFGRNLGENSAFLNRFLYHRIIEGESEIISGLSKGHFLLQCKGEVVQGVLVFVLLLMLIHSMFFGSLKVTIGKRL